MTPQEIEANQAAILAALAEHGVTPEAALAEEGRQKAMSRVQGTYAKAKERGYEGLAKRLEGMAETEGRAYAGRQSRRGRGGAGSAPSSSLPPPEQMLGTFMPAQTAAPTPAPAPSQPAKPDNMLAQYAPGQMPLSNFQMQGFNPRPGNMQTPDTLTGQEAAPSPSPASLTMIEASRELAPVLGDQYARPGENMVARPLLPQNDLEAEEQGDRNRMLMSAYRNIPAVGMAMLAPEARAAEAGMRGASALANSPLGRWIGREVVQPALGMVARNPLAAGGTLAGAATLATPGKTDDPTTTQPVRDAQSQLDELMRQQKALQESQATLDQEAASFRGVQGRGREAIKKAQQRLQEEGLYLRNSKGKPVKPDGLWGDGMGLAIEQYQKRINERRAANEQRLDKLATQIAGQSNAVSGLARDTFMREAEEDRLPGTGIIRNNPAVAGYALGAVLGPGGRWLTTRGVSKRLGNEVVAANRLLAQGAPDTPTRVAGVNQFYARGGADEPFRIDATAPQGFVAAANQPSAHALYPPANPYVNWADAGRVLALGGGAAMSEWKLAEARRELADAERAMQEQPSRAAADRVMRAQETVGAYMVGSRATETALATYPATAVMSRYEPRARVPGGRFRTERVDPDRQLAESEVMRLNNSLRPRDPPPLPPLDQRRYDTNFRLPPTAPIHPQDAAANITETWVSPTGRDIVTRRANGTWAQPGKRGSVKSPHERKGWRRIASAEPNYLADYAAVG